MPKQLIQTWIDLMNQCKQAGRSISVELENVVPGMTYASVNITQGTYSLVISLLIGSTVDANAFCFCFQDITATKEMAQILEKNNRDLEKLVEIRTKELQHAMQVKSRFLAVMSHGKTTQCGIIHMN